MKLAVATTNIPHEMPEVFMSLESAIQKYEGDGFEIICNLNTQPDLSRGGVVMKKNHLLAEATTAQIVLVDVQ